MKKIWKWASKLKKTGEQPSLRALDRDGKASPEAVEAAVERIFGTVGPARKGRLLLYAQRMHSGMGAVEIGRRYGRTHAVVRMAARGLEEQAAKDRQLASRLAQLSRLLQ